MRAARLKPLTAIVVLAFAAGACGCGLGDPYSAPKRTTGATPSTVANKVQPDTPYRDAGPHAAPEATARAAVARFARLYVNWTYRTLPVHRRELAKIAVGEAAATQRRAAAETGRDYELRAGRVANTGRLVALAPARGDDDRWVVVTRETTTGKGTYEGLPAAFHVTLVTVVRVGAGWAVSRWEPQT